MSSAQDPFYIVKDENQDSIDSLQGSFHEWERVPVGSGEQSQLTKELLSNCESIEWQVDELEKTISVAARDPSLYGINQVELEKRRKWTTTARIQVGNIKNVVTVTGSSSNFGGMHQELMRMPKSHQQQDKDRTRTGSYAAVDNDDFISSESDTQMLLIRQQDEELDELSASVERIGSVGLTIHDELLSQEKIIEDLGSEMESTSNRLDFVQVLIALATSFHALQPLKVLAFRLFS
ncbi:unnamed protein product [Lactuca virosa]|uniref:t-SNARE coiled-coil homology domain-containing protein n=1 Tax=Lactuca virosa TaxID=75947 RepID=A0AAU9LNR8_9ASTR|nr:unnamed protein product [Lactuca virosa]